MKFRSGLTSPWGLLKHAMIDYRRWLRTYLFTVAVALLPVILLSSQAANAPVSARADAYASVVVVVMLVALLSVAARQLRQEDRPTLKDTYYQGTATLVPFTLTLMLLFTRAFFAPTVGLVRLILRLWRKTRYRPLIRWLRYVTGGICVLLVLPVLTLNILLWNLALMVGSGQQFSDRIWLYPLILIVVVPALYVAVRGSLAPYQAALTGASPIVALRTSYALTRGRFLGMASRLGFLVLAAILLVLVVGLPLLLLGLVYPNANVLLILFRAIINLTGVPVVIIYLLHLYQQAHARHASSHAQA